MNNILYRIGLLAQNEGIKISALEKKIGASKGVLSRALSNNTDIQAKWLQKIVENFPQYNAEWLLTGNGEMMKSSQTADGDFWQVDKSSMDFMLGRYESLAVENAKLKDEINKMKKKIYPHSDDDSESLVAEPKNE